MDEEQTIEYLIQAIGRSQPQRGLIYHSNCGGQYA
jgi:hypothetical protein